jgi:hypothetical protein
MARSTKGEDNQEDEDGVLQEMKVLLVGKDKLGCKVFFCFHLSTNPIV